MACSQTSPPQSAAAGQEATSTPSARTDAQLQPQASPPPAQQAAPQANATRGPSTSATTPPQANAAPPSAPPAKPAAPPAPKFREVTIPAGTSLSVTVLSTLASNTSKVEDPVKGSLAKPIVIEGTTAVPSGSEISGSVIEAKESGRVKGKALVAFQFDRLVVRGETYRIQSARVAQEAAQEKGQDVKKGGVGAGLGAIVGGVAGGGKGAAIGAVAGGTGAVLATKGNEVQVEPGTVVTALLQEPITVAVPIK
jgi:hypothetical protein